jgi:DNA-binding MarR family transcriptional regulator
MASRRGTGRRKQVALEQLSSRVMELARQYQLQSRNRVCRHGITVTQCYALEALVERGGSLVTELASALALDKSNASRVSDSLVDLGLARVQPVPGNARARRLAARIAAEIEAEHRDAFAGFATPEIEACEQVLAALLSSTRSTR